MTNDAKLNKKVVINTCFGGFSFPGYRLENSTEVVAFIEADRVVEMIKKLETDHE